MPHIHTFLAFTIFRNIQKHNLQLRIRIFKLLLKAEYLSVMTIRHIAYFCVLVVTCTLILARNNPAAEGREYIFLYTRKYYHFKTFYQLWLNDTYKRRCPTLIIKGWFCDDMYFWNNNKLLTTYVVVENMQRLICFLTAVHKKLAITSIRWLRIIYTCTCCLASWVTYFGVEDYFSLDDQYQ